MILIVGKQETGWKEEDRVPRYRGNTDTISHLSFDSIAKGHVIAALCNLKSYMIADEGDSWGRNPYYTTPDMVAWEEENTIARTVRKEREERQKEAWNARPAILEIAAGNGWRVYLERITYDEKEQFSANRPRIRERLDIYGTRVSSFWIEDYISKDGKALKAKFMTRYGFDDKAGKATGELALQLLKIKQLIKEAKETERKAMEEVK